MVNGLSIALIDQSSRDSLGPRLAGMRQIRSPGIPGRVSGVRECLGAASSPSCGPRPAPTGPPPAPGPRPRRSAHGPMAHGSRPAGSLGGLSIGDGLPFDRGEAAVGQRLRGRGGVRGDGIAGEPPIGGARVIRRDATVGAGWSRARRVNARERTPGAKCVDASECAPTTRDGPRVHLPGPGGRCAVGLFGFRRGAGEETYRLD
jgi:hypothetical protein